MRFLAEHLPRIKAVAISIQLDDQLIIEKLTFKDLSRGIVHYRDQANNKFESTVLLPVEVKPAVAEHGYVADAQSNTISFRLPASPELSENSLKSRPIADFVGRRIPWNARELNEDPDLGICCAGCSSTLVRPGQIECFKALPSENWAEMMDFWHCHKPDDTNSTVNTSYSVSRFTPAVNSSFVGASYFLFNSETFGLVNCRNCGRTLGQREDESTVRLWKWNARLESRCVQEWYPYYYYVSAVIMDLIDSHAIYTFSVAKDETSERLLLWIFNPDIQFTTTGSTQVANGFKVFYSTEKAELPGLEQTRGDVENVTLPAIVYDSLVERLEQSTSALPANARKSGKWTSGILDKV